VRRRIDRQATERNEAINAVKSSKAFLGRGFRDIEMLLEAGFRELEDQRSSYMVNRRKKLAQRIEKDKARRAQRTAGARAVTMGSDMASPAGGARRKVDDGDDDEEDGLEDDSGSDNDSVSTFNSEAMAAMDFDELQARLAANDAKEKRALKRYEGDVAAEAVAKAEAEAADVRKTEYTTLAQSKMGKQAQIDELTARVAKEQAAAGSMKERLEGALTDEQTVMAEWDTLDGQLQEAELERATLVAAKQKAKEAALEKAQVAEAGLEELKESYRELRRKEEKMLRTVREAEAKGASESAALDQRAEALRHEREMWAERLKAAEEDRQALFKEAARIEAQLRAEKQRKAEAQANAAHYRELLKAQI